MFAARLQKQNPALSLMIPGRSVFTLAYLNGAPRNLSPLQCFWWDHKPEQALEAAPATVPVLLKDASQEDYDALVLPGGKMIADILRTLKKAISFVKSFFDASKPLAAICHAPWLLIERVLSVNWR